MPAFRRKSSSKKKVVPRGLVIDCSVPVNDALLDTASFVKFLQDRIKVDGKTGQLGDNVIVARDGKAKVTIKTEIAFSKRYLKYLTKKYLKKQQLRDWLRVLATGRDTYELRFFNIHDNREDDDEASDMEED